MIPTRARPSYLEVALASIAPQAANAGAELIVVDDAGPSAQARALAESHGARYEPHPHPQGLNVARNTGVERSTGELVVFVDDDVRAHDGWLAALLAGASEHPEIEVFTGPIRPCLDGPRPRGCGREGSPITSLDLGPEDALARYAWGANMAIRREALARVGPFDVALEDGGDEQEWQERLRAEQPDARVLYVAAAAVDHRRTGSDARLRSLARAAYARGRASRRFDAYRGEAPPLGRELLTLARCVGHVLRRRCPAGVTMVAHSAGRTREGLLARPQARTPDIARTREGPQARMSDATQPADRRGRDACTNSYGPAVVDAMDGPTVDDAGDDFLSGESGTVGGLDAIRRSIADEAEDAWDLASGRRLRLGLAARHEPPLRKVLALGVERPEHRTLAAAIRVELERSRHDVELHTCAPAGGGKFENLNRLLAAHRADGHDWLMVIDDDVKLPRGFLDRMLFLCERFALDLAQPAHRRNSHAAWQVTRRHTGSVVRETPFVEIGPVTAFARSTFSTLLPFPSLRMGWGLDLHWAALARERGWRCGVIDALPVGHRTAPAADAYSREAAVAEARAFLAEHEYMSAREAQQTLATHRRL
ncbi:MAG TPA: glycosyltransferase [Solirubrobacteraceae bacterium]